MSSSSSDHLCRTYLIEQGIHPSKADRIVNKWSASLNHYIHAVERMRKNGAGVGAIANALEAAAPHISAASPCEEERNNTFRATPENRARMQALLGYDPYPNEEDNECAS